MERQTGRIIKAIGGFYSIAVEGHIYECRARGLFRKDGVKPLVGDLVEIEVVGESTGYILNLLPRKNQLTRPALANLDYFVIVASVVDPAPNLLVMDKMLAIACHKEISPILVITKCDLGEPTALEEIYRPMNIPIFAVCPESKDGIHVLRAALADGISAFSGNSGVGKSSLLNRLDERLSIATGQTSQKLGRGRHTTRHVELYPTDQGGYIADTPGFSAVEMERYERIRKEELADCFLEFAPFLGDCQFTGCSHTVEKGCAVLQAVKEGKIHPSRHANYCTLYEEAKKQKDWEVLHG